MSSPGREDPEKVHSRGEELNCVSSNLTFIIAVLNSVGANVTITSAFPLAGTTPRVQNQLNQECMIERRAASLSCSMYILLPT